VLQGIWRGVFFDLYECELSWWNYFLKGTPSNPPLGRRGIYGRSLVLLLAPSLFQLFRVPCYNALKFRTSITLDNGITNDFHIQDHITPHDHGHMSFAKLPKIIQEACR
jgi:hypothetical protein